MSRRFAFLLPVAVLALVVAVAVGATLAATEGPTAFRVGAASVPQAAFHDELEQLAAEKPFASGITGAVVLTTPGAIDLGTTRVWLQFRIFEQLAHQRLERLGDRVRQVDRDAVDDFLGAEFVEALRGIPTAELRAQFRAIVASWMAVGRVEDLDLSTEFGRLGIILGRESRRPEVGVHVEPRYGIWDARRATVLDPRRTDSSPIRSG